MNLSDNNHFKENIIEGIDSFDIKELVQIILHHWKLVLLSMAISISSAFIYLNHTNKKCQIEASLFLKNENKNSNVEFQGFNDLGIVTANVNNIENEI